MTTPADNLVPLTGNALIDGLTWGAAWQFNGDAHTLTYSLSLNDNPNGGVTPVQDKSDASNQIARFHCLSFPLVEKGLAISRSNNVFHEISRKLYL